MYQAILENIEGELWELVDEMNDLPGVLSMSIGHTKRFLHLADRTVEVPLTATADEIRAALQDKTTMSITGLQSGAFQAKLAEMKQKIAEAQNQGLAKVEAAQSQAAAKVSAAIDGVVAKVDKEVEDALQEFAQFTNGGPE